jgi:predicted secreted protein
VIHGAVLVSAFLILWFLTLFCLLPMGLGANVDSDSGAPLDPQLGFKALIAGIIAAVLWMGFYLMTAWHLVDL